MSVYVAFDIETAVKSPTTDEINRYMEDEYSVPKNYKDPAKIQEHQEAALLAAPEKILEKKAFSIGGKKMIAVGVAVVDPCEDSIGDINVFTDEDPKILAVQVVTFLDSLNSDFRLVGFNIEKFDLPEFLKCCHLAKKYPKRKLQRYSVIDLMYKYPGSKLSEIAEAFGFLPEQYITGAAVQGWYERGEWMRIAAHNSHDIRMTAELFLATEKFFDL